MQHIVSPSQHSPAIRRTQLAALAGVVVGLGGLLGAPAAQADTSTPAGCTAEGQVWLLVVTEDGSQLANQCVGTPKTGTAALEAAGITIGRDGKGMLCTLKGHPASCPTKFNGQYWNYYQSDTAGKWTYASKGSDQSAPKPGTVEGWCYNKATEQSCTMPAVELGAPASSAPASTPTETATAASQAPTKGTEQSKSSGPWPAIVTLAALAGGAGGYLLYRRSRTKR